MDYQITRFFVRDLTLISSDADGGVVRVITQVGNLYEDNLEYKAAKTDLTPPTACSSTTFGSTIAINSFAALVF